MEFEQYDPRPAKHAKSKVDFAMARPGTSLWAATHNERVRLDKQFRKWAEETGSKLSVSTCRVGDEDPHGPGYRLLFRAPDLEIKPGIRNKLLMYNEYPPGSLNRHCLNLHGIFSNEDILAAILQEGLSIGSIAGAKEARLRLFNGDLQFCRDYAASRGHRVAIDVQRDSGPHPMEQPPAPRELAPPPLVRPAPQALVWKHLNPAQKARLQARGINAANWEAAFRSCTPTWTERDCLDALSTGHGDYNVYLLRLNPALADTGDDFSAEPQR